MNIPEPDKKPQGLMGIMSAVKQLDKEMRESSTCLVCGKPRHGMTPTRGGKISNSRNPEDGTTSLEVVGAEAVPFAEAGLCGCMEVEWHKSQPAGHISPDTLLQYDYRVVTGFALDCSGGLVGVEVIASEGGEPAIVGWDNFSELNIWVILKDRQEWYETLGFHGVMILPLIPCPEGEQITMVRPKEEEV